MASTMVDTRAGSESAARNAVAELIARENVQLVDLQFSDIAGGARAMTIPADLLASVLVHGYRFDGSALTGGLREVELDLYLVPDPATIVLLRDGGQPHRARLSCSVRRRDGQPFPGDPRSVLERALQAAADAGFEYGVAMEIEYYLFRQTDTEAAPPLDSAGYFGVGESDIAGTRDEILSVLDAMGVGVGGAHHETGPGQEELDLRPTSALRMADQVLTVRQVIRSVAQRRGMRASFMPKPLSEAPGSGAHLFQRLSRISDGNDVLHGEGDDLSAIGHQVIAGQLGHARAMCAVVCPSVNSYKRLAAGHRAPRHATWARLSQASLIRVPAPLPTADAAIELELRSPDNMANPYLALAIALACALEGVRQGDQPPAPLDENLVRYDDEELLRLGVPRLPETLGEALGTLADDEVVRAALGDYVADQFLTVKRGEWNAYRRHVSPWEREHYGG